MNPSPQPWTPQSIRERLVALSAPDPNLSDTQRATRARLIEVATEHFARAGYRKASVAQIARDAHIGKGSVYLYVQSKEHLLSACVAREKMSLLPHIERVLSKPASQQLEAMLYANALFCISAPLCGALMRGAEDFDALKRSIRAPLLTPPEMAADEARTLALFDALIRARAPDAPQRHIDQVRDTLLAALPSLAHLHSTGHRRGMSAQAFAQSWARMMAQGARYTP